MSLTDKQKNVAVAVISAACGAGLMAVLYKKIFRYTPPKVWKNKSSGGKFAAINAPTSGARKQKDLPKTDKSILLYSLATPNGVKVTTMLEEICAVNPDFDYSAWKINIMKGEQFHSGFVDVNPNSKIPCMIDQSDLENPINVFESGAILVHLAEKYPETNLLPNDPAKRARVMSWLMWQMGSAPYLGGGFGHFYAYAPFKIEYAINRFAMETKRQLHVLDQQLAKTKYIAGDEYSIADLAICPWYGRLVLGGVYGDANTFLSVQEYPNLLRWAKMLNERPAWRRGAVVNSWGDDTKNGVKACPTRLGRDDMIKCIEDQTAGY